MYLYILGFIYCGPVVTLKRRRAFFSAPSWRTWDLGAGTNRYPMALWLDLFQWNGIRIRNDSYIWNGLKLYAICLLCIVRQSYGPQLQGPGSVNNNHARTQRIQTNKQRDISENLKICNHADKACLHFIGPSLSCFNHWIILSRSSGRQISSWNVEEQQSPQTSSP